MKILRSDIVPERGMASLAISFAVGILAAQYCSFIISVFAAVSFVTLALIFCKNLPKSAFAAIAALFLLGFARFTISREVPPTDISHFTYQSSAFEGIVASDPDIRENRCQTVFKVKRIRVNNRWHKASGNVMVSIYRNEGKKLMSLAYGDHAIVYAAPYPPIEPSNPGQFSWGDYLARKGIYTCASVRQPSQIKILRNNEGNTFIFTGLKIKHYMADCIMGVHSKREGSVITGMLLGTYAYLPPEVFNNFSRTGTLHLLAASGYNCWILIFLVTPLMKLIKITPNWRNAVIIILLAGYLLVVGTMPSLLRAAIMCSLLLLAQPLGRVANQKNLFFTAGLIVLMINPSDLFDVGFQLSFLAVWALISIGTTFVNPAAEHFLLTAKIAKPARRFNHKLPNKILLWIINEAKNAGISTIAVTIITAPVIAYYFNYISLVSLPANIVLALGVPIVFADGIISALAVHLGYAGGVVGLVGGGVTKGMLSAVNAFGSMRYASISIASPTLLGIIGYYMIVYAAMSYLRAKIAEK